LTVSLPKPAACTSPGAAHGDINAIANSHALKLDLHTATPSDS